MPAILHFEDFTTPTAHANTPTENLAGYAAGFAAGREAEQATTAALSDTVVQTVTDWTFSFAEARSHVLQSLAPLIAALVDQVLPRVCEPAFRAAVIAQIIDAASHDTGQPILVRLALDQNDLLSPLLPAHIAQHVQIEGDNTLDRNTAVVTRADATTMLDVDSLFQAMTDTLSAIFDETDKGKAHGT